MRTDYDVIIIGAGAAGLSAANRLSKNNKNINVLLIEKEDVPGRKLSASGNGKCNLTNEDYGVSHYHGTEKEALKQLIASFSKDKVIEFVDELGILTYEKNGYYYPVSNQAKQVTAALIENAVDSGITYLKGTRVIKINNEKTVNKAVKRFCVTARLADGTENNFYSDYVILATGGLAAGMLGGSNDSYNFAKNMGLSFNELYPALSPIYVEDGSLKFARGVRIDGTAVFRDIAGTLIKEKGQIQFNEDSISGICIMNLSGLAWQLEEEECQDALFIDCLPDMSWDSLKEYFIKQQKNSPDKRLIAILGNIFPLPFANYLLKRLSLRDDELIKNVSEKNINRLTSGIKKLTFTPCKKADYEKAQVTGGGISLNELSIPSCESLKYPGLYLIGELLDVYGDCGGYNLTFAICSGLAAAEDILDKRNN